MNLFRACCRRTLANGVELCILPAPGSAVEIEIAVRTGALHEGKYLGHGLSHFLEHMMFQGCADFPGTAAADTIQRCGGDTNAYTSYDRTVYLARVTGEHVRTVFEVLCSMVRTPEFPEARFVSESTVICREAERCFDHPDKKLRQLLLETMFSGHPLSVPVIGYPESIRRVTRDMMTDYYRARYTPERIIVAVSGNVNADRIEELAGEFLGSWPRGGAWETPLPAQPAQSAPREREFVQSDALARLVLGVPLPDLHDPAIPALDVLFGLLGSGGGSRLALEFELRRQLAVQSGAGMIHCANTGLGLLSLSAEPGKLATLERELRRELPAIIAGKISRDEVEREKRQQDSDVFHQFEDPGSRCSVMIAGMLANNTPDFADEYQKKVRAVTVDAVRDAAARFLTPDHWNLCRQLPRPRRHAVHSAQTGRAEYRELCGGSGLSAFCRSADTTPLIYGSLLLPGTVFEPESCSGSSILLRSWLLAGTRRRSESEFLAKLDRLGGEIELSGGINTTSIHFSAPKRGFTALFDLVLEMLAEPRFGDLEFERERARILAELRATDEQPLKRAFREAARRLYGDHPYALGRGGSAAAIAQRTPEEVENFFRRLFALTQCRFGLAGAVTPAQTQTFADKLAAALPRSGTPLELPAEPRFPATTQQFAVELPREQCAIVRLLPGVTVGGANDFAFDLLLRAENGLASRLFKQVREKRALVYSVGMMQQCGFHRGVFGFYAQTTAERADETSACFQREIARLGAEGLGPEEFSIAHERTAFELLQENESVSGGLEARLLHSFYGRSNEEWLRLPELLHDLTRSNVNAALAPLFTAPACVECRAGRCRS